MVDLPDFETLLETLSACNVKAFRMSGEEVAIEFFDPTPHASSATVTTPARNVETPDPFLQPVTAEEARTLAESAPKAGDRIVDPISLALDAPEYEPVLPDGFDSEEDEGS